MEKKNRVNIYIYIYIYINSVKKIHTCKVAGRGREEQRKETVWWEFIMNYLIYTLHIEEMDMNKRFNVSLICKV